MTRPQPAYVADDPLMAAAFASFMRVTWDKPEVHADFAAATGRSVYSPPKTPIDAMIDKATGYAADYAEAFVAWVIQNIWGEEGDPRLDEEDEE